MNDQKLSKNFYLHEFLVSQTAERHGIDMTPDEDVRYYLEQLVETCLQPLRERLAVPMFISSGYRPDALNRLIGGSRTSAHRFGRAADFVAVNYSPREICEIVVEMKLPFDQIIHEFGRWVHLGISDHPRGEMLTAFRREGRTQYAWGIRKIEELVA